MIPIGAEESDHAFGLLEGLDEPVEQNPVKAAIPETNAILVMLVESVHGELLCGEIPRSIASQRFLWAFLIADN